MDVTEDGMKREEREEQPLNALIPMDSTEDGML